MEQTNDCPELKKRKSSDKDLNLIMRNWHEKFSKCFGGKYMLKLYPHRKSKSSTLHVFFTD